MKNILTGTQFILYRNVPTLLVYGEGELKQQIVGTARFGGSLFTLENVEIFLKGIGAIGSFGEEPYENERFKMSFDMKRNKDSIDFYFF